MTGTGFLPNTQISFTATGSGIDANELKVVTTDATGAFATDTSATSVSYLLLYCSTAGSVTVTATDGTNTATATFNYPAC